MTNQHVDDFERIIETGKVELGIDKKIVEEGRSKGRDVTQDYVQAKFDPALVALFRRLASPPLPPPPPLTGSRPKEDPDVKR